MGKPAFLLENLEENLFLWLFPPLEATYIPWLVALFFIFKAKRVVSFLPSDLCLILTSSPQFPWPSFPVLIVYDGLNHLVMSDSLRPHEAHQAPPSMRFSRQEYWSGLLCPPPGDLPDPGIEPVSLKSPSSGPSKSSLTWTSNKHPSPSSPKNGFIPPREAHLAFARSQWLAMPITESSSIQVFEALCFNWTLLT